MARNSYFQFKQFRVEQGNCAMKVTTDACLFGAVAEVESATNILDIGAGTGLLSLMAAQRSKAKITAVELDKEAYEQTCDNFKNSPWSGRLSAIHDSIQMFAENTLERFDCILCNPPFFQNCYKAPDQRRSQARHTDTLSFEELTTSINTLLSEEGLAWVILPSNFSASLAEPARANGMNLVGKVTVQSSKKHQPHRDIMVIAKKKLIYGNRTIKIYSNHPEYGAEFSRLLQPYYLNI